MLTKIKSIIIFGGGTSGWMTAAYLSRNLRFRPQITLIEDVSKGPIGVGEGTQPSTAPFLWDCGLHPKDWMKMADASFKYGVELTGWNDEPYFVDNDVQETSLIAENFYTNHYFQNKPYSEYREFLPAYQLAKENLSPKLTEYDQNFAVSLKNSGAFHFNAYKLVDALKSVCLENINHIDATIENVVKGNDGIEKLIDTNENEYSADLYIDCSGFTSILMDKTLNEPFESYADYLLCDSAIAMPTQFKDDPKKECHPYTKATTMNAGWRWTIPTFNRVGNGYVYSSKHISAEDAEKELRDVLGEYDAPAKHLKIRCGKHERVAVKNVVAVGLSAGFIEPLEATGITFTTSIIKALTVSLNNTGNILNTKASDFINDYFDTSVTEILAFVWAHYAFSTRNDTEFWKEVRTISHTILPEKSKNIIENLLTEHPLEYILNYNSMFSIPQWFSMLHAGGVYAGREVELTDAQEKYGKYFCNVQKERVRLAKELFPNHYEYLKDMYSDDSL
jgi:2-polyprenyl-6-methoxyphenol hydroxylase-like FAD-dependent oxidoreductase